jgi:hypothetical protein
MLDASPVWVFISSYMLQQKWMPDQACAAQAPTFRTQPVCCKLYVLSCMGHQLSVVILRKFYRVSSLCFAVAEHGTAEHCCFAAHNTTMHNQHHGT